MLEAVASSQPKEAGFNHHLVKPADPERIQDLMNQLHHGKMKSILPQ